MPRGRIAIPFSAYIWYGPDCWEWMGGKNQDGYGMYRLNGSTKLAHRVTFETRFGSIGVGIEICHKCDNPACVRPDHLFAGTKSDNQRDSVSKKRHVSSKKTHCPQGHEYNSVNASLTNGIRACRVCCREKMRRRRNASNQSV